MFEDHPLHLREGHEALHAGGHRQAHVLLTVREVAEPLSKDSAAFMAHSASGWEAGSSALQDRCREGGEVFDVALPALRWAAWRRRVYTGPEDHFLMTTGFAWLPRAADVESTGTFDTQTWATELTADVLSPDLYNPVSTSR